MFYFINGVFVGIFISLFIIYVILTNPFGGVGRSKNERLRRGFIDQFPPLRLQSELREFLKSNDSDGCGSKWESCFSFSLLLHFLFQEHKDTRYFRRWLFKRLQLELSDLTTRSAAGRLIQDIRIRDLSIGSQFPIINKVRIENYRLRESDGFDSLDFLVDLDYSGGFQTSIDVAMIWGRFAQISIKVLRLSGKARFTMTRQPFTHWSLSFIEMPLLDMEVETQWQGKQLKHVIPFITQQFRRIFQRKHVWPSYKIRYRPFFTNPNLMPSAPIDSFNHVKVCGCLEVTILQCTRLNTHLIEDDDGDSIRLYCSLFIDSSAFNFSSWNSVFTSTVLLVYSRSNTKEYVGLTFKKLYNDSEICSSSVQISSVAVDTPAFKAGFKTGDIVLAVNNVPIRNERQLIKLLCGTICDLSVLVERTVVENSGPAINNVDGEEYEVPSFIEEKMETGPFLFDDDDDDGVVGTVSSNENSKNWERVGLRFRSVSAFDLANHCEDLFDLICEDDRSLAKTVKFTNGVGLRGKWNPLVATIRRSRSLGSLISNLEKQRKQPTGRNVDFGNDEIKSLSETREVPCVETVTSSCALDEKSVLEKSRGLTRREKLKIKAAEVAAASKAKVSDFWNRRNENPDIEIAFDVIRETPVQLLSMPSPCDDQKSILLSNIKKSRLGSEEERFPNTSSINLNSEKVLPTKKKIRKSKILRTEGLQLSEDVLWGQSLHFELDPRSSRYLNVNVCYESHAKRRSGQSECSKSDDDESSLKPKTLGYTSIYIPQILDDCRLTTSNCHREIFHLKPPVSRLNKSSVSPTVEEASQHAGFDSRICCGDILLGFRFFPDGLPIEAVVDNEEGTVEAGDVNGNESNVMKRTIKSLHQFENISLKSTVSCSICRRKIWFKSASQCRRCFLVCHNKCTNKDHKALDSCDVSLQFDDSTFEVVDGFGAMRSDKLLPDFCDDTASINSAFNDISPLGQTSCVSVEKDFVRSDDANCSELPKRRGFGMKLTEKWHNTWNKVGKRKVQDSTVLESSSFTREVVETTNATNTVSIKDVIPDVIFELGLPPSIPGMIFHPGDAYDEYTIGTAKIIGKKLFSDLCTEKRKDKINQQMDYIQSIINETTIKRLEILKTSSSTQRAMQNQKEFDAIDSRLQALAMLMLHYCAAFQDCIDANEVWKAKVYSDAETAGDEIEEYATRHDISETSVSVTTVASI